MGHNADQRLPALKKLRCLMIISLISILPLTLLLWAYRPSRSFQLWTQYSCTTDEPQISVQQNVSQKCIPANTVFQGQSASLVRVNGTKTLLISAFLEHRSGRKTVRVVAIALRREKVAYRCYLRCQGDLHVSKGIHFTHRDHFGFQYGTAGIICPIPKGCEIPSHVALTSAVGTFADKLDSGFLEVKNQKMKNGSFPYNFTVCVSTMYNFTNVLQLVQSLEMLRILGVNRVVIYKTNCSIDVQRVLDFYSGKGLVEVIPWSLSTFLNVSRGWLPRQGPGDLHYFGQIPALNDCLYRNMYRSKYVALHDMDELILPKSVNSWSQLLPLLEKKFGADKCYQFENNIFPNNLMLPPPYREKASPRQDCWEKVSGVNILAHLYQEPIIPAARYKNFKIMVNPRAVYSTSVHGVLNSKRGCTWVYRNIARIYHIRPQRQPKLRPDQLIYDNRLLSYSAPLIPAVNTALKESGLIPVDSTC